MTGGPVSRRKYTIVDPHIQGKDTLGDHSETIRWKEYLQVSGFSVLLFGVLVQNRYSKEDSESRGKE